MKTLLMYQGQNLSGDDLTPKFKEIIGDYRHLNDCYVNTYIDEEQKGKDAVEEQSRKEKELMDLLPEGTEFLSEPTKDWDFFIHCGFLP